MKQAEVGAKIVQVAKEFIGLKEVKPNAEWSDEHLSDLLLKMMKEAGWQEGWPYCAAFVEAIYRKALTELNAPDLTFKVFKKDMCPSVLQSYNAFKKDGLTEAIPVPGSIFFMKNGDSENGHAGLVVEYDAVTKEITTIEGNTGAKSAIGATDREGDGIYSKKRIVSFKKSKSLYFLGFVNPPVWA